MACTLVIAPAAAGKTEYCLERIVAVQRENPLAYVQVILPDQNQVSAFRRRLAYSGGAFGVHVGTFPDAYRTVLRGAGKYIPRASSALTHKLTRRAIDTLSKRGELEHYAPIADRPGLTTAIRDILAELKRGLIRPEQFQKAVIAEPARLQELARLYAEYQQALVTLDYADTEGLGWLAVQALQEHTELAADWRLLVVDGFDSFNTTMLEFLSSLTARVTDTVAALSGEAAATRRVYRRFVSTREQLQATANWQVQTLPPAARYAAPLVHLERDLFENGITPTPVGPNITWLECQTQRLEARAALRWLKARIRRDNLSPAECAVIARDLGPYRPFLREAAAEFGIPLRFLGGEPLLQNPALAAILAALELHLTWQRGALIDVVRSPYLDLSAFGLSHKDAAAFVLAAQQGQVIQGLDEWRAALIRLAGAAEQDNTEQAQATRELRGAPAQALLEGLERFAQFIQPPARGTLDAYLHHLQEKFFRADGLHIIARIQSADETVARDAAALVELRDILHALGLAAYTLNDAPTIDYAEFLSELRAALAVATYDPDSPETRQQARIYAGNIYTARGISYRAVAILGLSEGIFPARENEDPFLTDADRARLNAKGIGLPVRERGGQATLFYEAVTRAREFLLLTRPYLAQDGETWEASPYWNATLDLFTGAVPQQVHIRAPTDLADAASRPELLQALVRAETLPADLGAFQADLERAHAHAAILRARLAREPHGPYEGDLTALQAQLSERFGAAHVWSPSRLEAYSTCRYYFFTGSALELSEQEPPEPGLDARQLGILLHHILEQVYRETPDAMQESALLETLERIAPALLERAPNELGFRPTALWAHERAEILQKLSKTISELSRHQDGFVPVFFEQRFGGTQHRFTLTTTAGPIRLRGIIDRIDQNSEGNLRIIDYKTGGSGFAVRDLIEGRRLQLALYAAAAQALHAPAHVVDGWYWNIRGADKSSVRLHTFYHVTDDGKTYSGTPGALALAQAHVGNSVAQIRAGAFEPNPPEGGCPAYCPARKFCWHYTPRP